jgi:D-lactate dehydrogenase
LKIAVFDTHSYDRHALDSANVRYRHELTYFELRLTTQTAALAAGYPAVCPFVNDRVDAPALEALRAGGTTMIALRSAGYNHVDLEAAARLGVVVARVPEYSPYAVAEHTVGLVLALNRRLHRAHNRVREANFSLDGLVGFDLHGKVFGIVGTGRIGSVVARIMHGFGCRLLAFDGRPDERLSAELHVRYVDLRTLFQEADVISLHVPLTPSTRHLIDAAALAQMKQAVMLVNTGRGALVDTRSLIDGLKRGKIGGAALDVYEEEEGLFFRNLSDEVLQDDVLARLLTFPNVLITAHQAFLTHEALANIAETTLANVRAYERGEALVNEVKPDEVLRP